jgi:hemerythrin
MGMTDMPTWDHEDCDPLIETEHTRLYRMMNKLEPVIILECNGVKVARAISMLQKRMADHFHVEEELFVTADWESRQVMIRDHRDLLSMLSTLADIPADDLEARRGLFTAFLEALTRHDNDVDAPLFSRRH